MNPYVYRIFTAALLLAVLAGCAPSPASPATPPRPVKVEVVSEAAAHADESFVGTLRARQRSDLGFESPGRIAAILVDVGDRVRAGQVLARLQEGPARWRLEKAQADRAAAIASLAEREAQLAQHESLARDQIISDIALRSVRTQRDLAISQRQAADAAVALAQRDMALSHITAPFDGKIVARLAQPHTDIGAGQPLLQIEGEQMLEVVAMLPEGVARRLSPGKPATASVTQDGRAERRLPMTLERLSARSESGSLVQAIFRIEDRAADLRSGGVVSVELPRQTTPGVSLPAPALLPSAQQGMATVYVLDGAKNRVARREVRLGEGTLPGGRVPVAGGLAAGEWVVVAGAAFLSDGQAAVRHEAQTLLVKEQP